MHIAYSALVDIFFNNLHFNALKHCCLWGVPEFSIIFYKAKKFK